MFKFRFCPLLLASIVSPAVAEPQAATNPGQIVQPGVPAAMQPMTPSDRWGYYVKENFLSPGAFFRSAGPALGDQIDGAPPEWGQGMSGYGKRLADQFASRTIQGTIEYGLSAALDTNMRYRPCECRGFFPRLGYAIRSNVVTYNNDGGEAFNLPNVAGVYGGVFSSLAWYPSRYSYKDALREGTQRMIIGGSFNVFREFWPQIRKAVPFARKQ